MYAETAVPDSNKTDAAANAGAAGRRFDPSPNRSVGLTSRESVEGLMVVTAAGGSVSVSTSVWLKLPPQPGQGISVLASVSTTSVELWQWGQRTCMTKQGIP